jgi:D-glycero-D-manno-heptose 1,7-bisphosphate phosphatase
VSCTAAVFLDRDGVLNELVRDPAAGAPESPLRVEDVRLVAGAGAALAALQRAGCTLVCVSNQPAAAKGTVSVEQLHAVHARVLELLAGQGVKLAASRLCLHHPAGAVAELSGPCACRKPAPGMLLDLAGALRLALDTAWMVGDTDADVGAGKAAGCATVLIDYPGSAHKRGGQARPDIHAPSLAAAVEQILGALSLRESETVTCERALARHSKRAAK